MADPIIGIALGGLKAAQLGLNAASHNISNAATPGYTRQDIIQAANTPRFTGSGYIGQGVHVQTVRRNYNEFLEGQLRYNQSQGSFYDTRLDQIKQINDLLADPRAGLSPALESFFGAAQDLSSRPGDAAARQSFLSASQALATRIRDTDQRLAAARVDSNEQIRASVSAINALSTQIADINRQIVLANSNGSGQQIANDLLDKRDALIRDLTQQANANVVAQDDGSINVFLGTGQVVVAGAQSFQLSVRRGEFDAGDVEVGVQTGASFVKFQSADISGGTLGGLLAFREQNLAPAQNAVGRIALGLAESVNAQHRLGQDRNGALGGNYFSVAQPQAIASVANTGTAAIGATIADLTQVTTSDYRLKYDGSNYTLTRLSDGTTQTFASLPQTVDGLTLQISSGTPAAGDQFEIQPTRAAAATFRALVTDPNKIAASAPILAAVGSANTGTGRVSAGQVVGPNVNPNLTQPVTITFTSPTTFNVTGTGTGNPTGVAYTPGASISYNGWTIEVSGAPAGGDTFTVTANTNAAGDNRNMIKLAAIQTQPLLEGASTTLQGAFGQLVSRVGNETREIEVGSQAQASLVELTQQAQQAASGVNLDEEAAKLLQYQQAYQAAGRVIGIAQGLFDELLSIMR